MTAEARRTAIVDAMATTLEASGYRCSETVPLIEGRISSHFPDVFFKGPKRLGIVAVVMEKDFKDQKALKERLELFTHYAQSQGVDFHVSCFAGLAGTVKRFCQLANVRYSKLWEI